MNRATHTIATLLLVLLAAGSLYAQQAEPAATATVSPQAAQAETAAPAEASTPAGEANAETTTLSAESVRQEFNRLIDRHPPELARILGLEPSLLSNQAFLARYPELEQFVAENAEVRRNPHFFVGQFAEAPRQIRTGPFEEVVEALSIAFVFALITFALGWFVRTIIEQKRWNRLSRTQSEVHNKILDRFGSTEEVLAYIKTPAGTKFLESAPIPLHSEPVRQQNVPLSRALWSLQAGVVVAAAGLGLFLVSIRYDQETAQDLFALGVITFFIGAGFIASAGISIFMSRRLGLWQDPGAAPAETFNDSGVVR